MPLNRDWLTDMIEQNPGGLPIAGFTGNLDSNGSAQADAFLTTLRKLPPSMDELDFVVVLTPPQGDAEASAPIILPIAD